jgi:hypothetical protein
MRSVCFIVIVGLLARNASAGDYCDAISLQQRFERAEIVVLAKVTESTYSDNRITTEDRVFFGTAILVVTKSWKGPYVPGTTIKTGPPDVATGLWNTYPVQVGDEVLVFANMPTPMLSHPGKLNPLWLDHCGVTDAAHSSERLAFLDSLTAPNSAGPGPRPN